MLNYALIYMIHTNKHAAEKRNQQQQQQTWKNNRKTA